MEQTAVASDEPDFTGVKVLIADDDRTAHIKFKKILVESGFEVSHAYDGGEALAKAQEEQPDVLLLDISMPLMDGRDVCKKLKGRPENADMVIIMVTGKDQQYDRMLGYELGADDYVTKPCTPHYLKRTIEKILRKIERRSGAEPRLF